MIILYSKCFSKEDIERVFKIECFQKDKDTFQKTHYSLSFTFKDPRSRETQMMEDALLEDQWKIGLKDRLKIGEFIRPYIIWGAPGTGKTELCRFLELFIPTVNPEYETKRVSKRELAMGGILGVAQSLSELEIDLADRLLSRHGDVGVEDVAIWAIGNLVRQGKVTINVQNKDEIYRMLKTHIRNNIERRIKQIETVQDISKIETTLEFITKKDMDVLGYYGVKMDVNKVNRELYQALTRFVADVDDVKKLIFDFVKRRNDKGKIPVLIFDDVTHLGELVNDFISVITDISGSEENYVCDFIIGTTTDFYFSKFKDSLASTARARVSEVKFSPEEKEEMSHANWLLGQDGLAHFLDFVLRYLDATRKCTNCSRCKKEPFLEETHNYYPFTKTFLINLYNRLLREKDEPPRKGITVSITPRFIIQVLRNALVKFAESTKPPSSFMDDCLILSTLDFFKLKQDEKEKLKDFLSALWWYGNHSKDGTYVSIDVKILDELDLGEQIPSELRGQDKVKLDVIPLASLTPEEITFGIPVGPKAVDDASLMANIRGWCRDEGSRIAIEPIVNGFNEVVKILEKNLPGSNNFRNVMNYNSSRDGETIEFLPPGKKECIFWIGELRDDDLQIYIMSKYKEDSLRPYQEKGFLTLLLNEDDFFSLYKLGTEKTSNREKTKYLIEFLNLKRDDVLDALWRQRLKIKNKLETELGHPIECFILSSYLLANKLMKSQASLKKVEDPEDFKQLFSAEIDLKSSDWPPELGSLIEKLETMFETIEDLFHSFFSLRGEGSIIDYSLLEETWTKIKDAPYEIIKDAKQVNDRFILSKSRKKFNDIVFLMNTLLNKIEIYSKIYDEATIQKEIDELKQLVVQLSNKKRLVESLKLLRNKLKAVSEVGVNDLDKIIDEINSLENISEIIGKLDLAQERVKHINDCVDKSILLAIVDGIKKLEVVHTAKKLNEFLNNLEKRTASALENELLRLKEQIKKYLEIIKVL